MLMGMQAGDPQQGFEQALDAGAYGAAWRYCCRLSATREDAEDLLQDALAQAYVSHRQLRDSAKFKGWLLSIVRSKHLMRLRAAGRRPVLAPDYALDFVNGAEVGPLIHEVLAALAQLKPAWREVLVLHYMEGLGTAEVAQVLGLRELVAQGWEATLQAASPKHVARE
jgi:RNA polymerase sigma-70 factor (ECF subfamily)